MVGRGTGIMSDLHEGDRVEVLGPLGRGFDLGDPADGENPGRRRHRPGAPVHAGRGAASAANKVRLLMGGRTRDDILAVTEFERLGVETYVSTDDGSLGEEGLVTQVLERKLAKYPRAERLRLRADADDRGGAADLRRAGRAAAGLPGGAHGLRGRRLPGLRGQGGRPQRDRTPLPLHLQGGAGLSAPNSWTGANWARSPAFCEGCKS